MRIDVDNTQKGLKYAIPEDNPFINKTITDRRGKKRKARPEIYAYGIRNVWRMAFDRETGTLWAADVGQNLWEEINIIAKGGNYGWNIREATHWFRPDGRDDAMSNLIDPVWEYHHDIGKSITGGSVYRGSKVPALVGKYVYGDYATGLIWALDHDGARTVANYSLTGITSPDGENVKLPIMTFGEDQGGEIYFGTTFGQLYSFEAVK